MSPSYCLERKEKERRHNLPRLLAQPFCILRIPLLPNLLVLFSARQIRLPWQRAPSERKKRTEMVPRVWLTCMRLDRDDSLGCTDEPKEKKGQNL